MVRICKMKYMDIYSNMKNGYIVYNTRKEFSVGHTHINNFNTAKYVAYLALYQRLPRKGHLSNYLIDSVIRISSNESYINKMKKFKENNNKKEKY